MKKFLKVYGFIVKDKLYDFLATFMYLCGDLFRFTEQFIYLQDFKAQKIYIKNLYLYNNSLSKMANDLYKLNPEWV